MAKPALGRGLGALLGVTPPGQKPGTPSPFAAPASASAPAPTNSNSREHVQRVPLKAVHPCPFQPRKEFSEATLQELADSIKEQGIVQPLIVRPKADDQFELIAGERRWRAAQRLGLTEIPVLIREADDRSVLELALIENLQRENLNPLEEALGFSQLIEQFQLTQEVAAAKVGKSRAAVANALRLLKLPPEIQEHLRAARISVGHAKVLLGLPKPEDQKAAAEKIVSEGLNVRQTEDLVAQWSQPKPESKSDDPANDKGPAPETRPDVHVADLSDRLQERLGTKVNIRYRAGKGAIEIRFFTDSDLDRLLEVLGIPLD